MGRVGEESRPQRELPGQDGVSKRSGRSEHPFSISPTSQHQQQVLQAMERAKQVTVGELNSLIGVSHPGPCPVLGRPYPRSLHQ